MSEVTLERFNDTGATGFVKRMKNDETVRLKLVRGQEVLAEGNADLFRPDTVAKQLSEHPYCGFVLPIPVDKIPGGKADVIRSDGVVLARGLEQQTDVVNELGLSAKEILGVCDHPFYGINGWAIQSGTLTVSGVLMAPGGRYSDIECVGQPGVSFKFLWPIFSANSDAFYWYFPGAPYIGFRLDINLAESSNDSPYFEFYLKIKGEGKERSTLRNISVPKDLRAFQNLPADFNVRRVQNLSNTVAATVAGYSDYRRIVQLASRYIKLDSKCTVLDWGCGFGRVCRYFPNDFPECKVIGVEIDDLNLQWMQEHSRSIRPVKTDLKAKIDIPDCSVDLIYGISVMTHIREAQQGQWLRELTRILSPNGVMLLTTAGAGSFAFSSRWLGRPQLEAWSKNGFVEIEQASAYDRDIGGGDYYIQAKQSPANTRERWGKIIPVVDIIPSVFGYQDVVVMRKNAPSVSSSSSFLRLKRN
jgi:SAM-dependent methyltransferase